MPRTSSHGESMTRREKIFIAIYVFAMLLLILSIPISTVVHKKSHPCCSAKACAEQHHHEKTSEVSNAPFTDQELQAWYEGFNADYFINQLPKNVRVVWGDLTPSELMGLTERSDAGFLITIDRKTNPTKRGAEWTAVHELCHVKTWEAHELDHGPKFQSCMIQLADKGAFEGIW